MAGHRAGAERDAVHRQRPRTGAEGEAEGAVGAGQFAQRHRADAGRHRLGADRDAVVADRLRAFGDAGIETFMLQFQPFEAEMRRFAAEVMPRVRRGLGG